MPERDLDVVVFGATGVTGRRVAAYLAKRSRETGASWAAAARDAAKLDRVLGEAGVSAPETLAADVGDPGSLAAMAARAKVVLDLVGPYTLYGRPVIEACVANGAHYVDLSGEIPFVRGIIDAFDEPRTRGRGQGDPGVRLRGAAARPRGPAGGGDGARALGRGPLRGRRRGHDREPAGPAATLRRALGRDDAEPDRGHGRPQCVHGHRPGGADHRPGAGGTRPAAQPDPARAAPTRRDGGGPDGARRVHQPGGDPPHRRARKR